MFGFWKKKDKDEDMDSQSPKSKKKHTNVDKLLMGAIVGAAVGSVVGMKVQNQRDKQKKAINPKEFKKIPREVE